MTRNAEPSLARNAIVVGNIVGFGCVSLMDVWGVFGGGARIDFLDRDKLPQIDVAVRLGLEGLLQAVASCGVFYLGFDKVTYCDRPLFLKFDASGRPHCDDGPAVRYDRWIFYYLNGVQIPGTYIETPADDLKLERILQGENGEVRRRFEKVRFRATAFKCQASDRFRGSRKLTDQYQAWQQDPVSIPPRSMS